MDAQMKVGAKVRVSDSESPWSGRDGELIATTPMMLVRFKADLGFHDRYMAAEQLELVPAKPRTATGEITISFDSREYLFNHGAEPRGRGYWAFEWNGETIWAPNGITLGEAKKWLKAELLKRGEFGLHVVTVCS